MNVTITVIGQDFKLDFGGGKAEYHSIEDLDHKTSGTHLEFYKNGELLTRHAYAEILAPAGADVEAKADAISKLVADAQAVISSGSGDNATVTPVAGDAAVFEVAAANAVRLEVVIYNDTNKTLFVKYGSGATSGSFTETLVQGESMATDKYKGVITAIGSGGISGDVLVTEVTP